MAVKDGLGPRPVAQTAKHYFLNRLETSSKPWLYLRFCTANCHPARVLLSWSWLSFCTAPVQAGVQGPCRRAKTPWQWRTDWAAARSPDCQTLLSEPIIETSSKPWLYLRSALSSKPWLSCTAPVHAGSKDLVAGLKHHGSEGRIEPAARSPDCQTLLSEPTWNYSFKPWLCLPTFLHCQLPPCSCPPGAGFRSAQLRSKLESKDRVAGLKHHGSEGRIGPAACSPDCQTLLSAPTRNYSSKPWLYLRFCTANCHPARVLLELAFVLHSSGPSWSPRTVSQG